MDAAYQTDTSEIDREGGRGSGWERARVLGVLDEALALRAI